MLNQIGYWFKYILYGGIAGFLVLFFHPDSKLPVNYYVLKDSWIFLQQLQRNESSLLSPSVPSFADAAQLAGPSVVSINTFRPKAIRPLGEDKILDVTVGIGSGVIINSAGYIVTNYHVIQGAERVSVNFIDGRKRYADIIGVDPSTDIAVLRVDEPNLTPAKLGSSKSLRVGDLVVAIGNPLSLGQTVTMGVVSDIDHGPLFPHIKTDATINYGNSGGALIDARGRVVGINSRKLNSKVSGDVGINIAIPIDIVTSIVDEIIKNGKVTRNWLGIDAVQLNRLGYENLFPNVPEGLGIVVRNIEPDSPAQKAGILPNDLITHLNGKPIYGMVNFYEMFKALPVGATIKLQLIRNSQNVEVSVKLTPR